MAERDELDRSVALAKSVLRAPPGASDRVRARLAGSAAAAGRATASPLARAVPSRWPSLLRAAAWVGVGLCAGYWLGFHRVGAPRTEPPIAQSERPASAALDSPALAPIPTAPAERALAEGAASAPVASAQTQRTRDGAPARPLPRRAVRRAERPTPAARHAVASSAAHGKQDTLGAELALLERAERAIRAGEGALALAFLDQLDREFPASSLREERAAARLLAACAAARSGGPAERASARASAEQFLTQSPSVYAERLRDLCELGSK